MNNTLYMESNNSQLADEILNEIGTTNPAPCAVYVSKQV